MGSRPFRPLGLPIYVAGVPAAPFTRSYPRRFTFYVADPLSSIETRSLPRPLGRRGDLVPGRADLHSLAALPSTRAMPDRDVFYACHDIALAKAGRSSHSFHLQPTRLPLQQAELMHPKTQNALTCRVTS